ILANSRPYEGLIYSRPFAGAVLVWLGSSKRPPLRVSLSRIAAPLVVVLTFGGLATSYYYYRVTGDPFRMTYQVNRATYAMAPYFLWQTPQAEPIYHHAIFRSFYRWELGHFEATRIFAGFLRCS